MKNRTARMTRVLLVLGIFASVSSGCSASSTSGHAHLTVYNGQHLQTAAALVTAFEQSTGISVTLRTADEAVLANQLKIEGARSHADVFIAGNSPALETVANESLLTRLPDAILSKVPRSASSPAGRWVGVTARVSVLAYSRTSLKTSQLPSSILDLAKPRWRGKIGLAPSESDFQPIVASVERSIGPKRTLAWLEGLKANAGSHLYPSNESMLAAINRGDIEIGVLEQYYWYRMVAQVGARNITSALATFHAGDAGYVLSISGAGVLASSHHKSAADRFVAFMVSPRG